MVNSKSGIDKGFDRPLVLGIVLVLALILASAAVSAYNVHRLRQDSELVDHTHQVISRLEAVMEEVRTPKAGSEATSSLVSQGISIPTARSGGRVEDFVQQVAGLTADNPAQQSRLPELRKRIAARLDTLFANARLRESQGFNATQESIATDVGHDQMRSFRETH